MDLEVYRLRLTYESSQPLPQFLPGMLGYCFDDKLECMFEGYVIEIFPSPFFEIIGLNSLPSGAMIRNGVEGQGKEAICFETAGCKDSSLWSR